jgi:DNA-binding NarL/FixJ family response regulator
MSDSNLKNAMHALLLCHDAQFLGTTHHVLQQMGGMPRVVGDCGQALAAVEAQKFDVVVVDWREIDDVAEFLCAVKRSVLNHDCVLVAIARDVLDVRQAFTAGVHFLIHKPASIVQIERCLRTAYLASIARRRKTYRAPVEMHASLGMRNVPAAQAILLNLGEGGAALRLNSHRGLPNVNLSVGDSASLSFFLPGTQDSLHVMGRVVWATSAGEAGIQFTWMAEAERIKLEVWLTDRMARSFVELRNQLAAVYA